MCDAVEGAPSWEELRQALERARSADAGLERFGAKTHQYRWAPPAALTEVEGFEREIGTRLPEDYRAFLLQAGNGGAILFMGCSLWSRCAGPGLKLRLCQSTVRAWDEEERRVTLRWPDSHLPPAPYYYDLCDWSAIGRMSALRDLAITEICVEDFSFLARCKELRTLSLRNTNFTDCRMLLELPKLRTMDLSLCRLTYTEALEELQGVDIRR